MTDEEIVAAIREAWKADTNWEQFGKDVDRIIHPRRPAPDQEVE